MLKKTTKISTELFLMVWEREYRGRERRIKATSEIKKSQVSYFYSILPPVLNDWLHKRQFTSAVVLIQTILFEIFLQNVCGVSEILIGRVNEEKSAANKK